MSYQEQVVACPYCKCPARIRFETDAPEDERVWTDGCRKSPGGSEPPTVVQCAGCDRAYWLADALEGNLESSGDETQELLAAAAEARQPSLEEYERALASGPAAEPVEERNLRILAWWRANDALRELPAGAAPPPDHQALLRPILEPLIAVLTDLDDSDRLMRAEAMRELGRFDEALSVLEQADDPDAAPVAGLLRALCARGDTEVRELSALQSGEPAGESVG